MERRQLVFLLAGMGAATLLAGCGGGGTAAGLRPVAADRRGVIEVARANDLGSFVRAVETAGLTNELSGAGPFTLFAPSDAAFRAAGVSPTGNRDTLRRLVAYHIVPGQVGSSFMAGMDMNYMTSTGDPLNVNGRGSGIRVNQASILRADIEAANGVIHVVDQVLRPA
jgi:uncharacterized surface protein with fasciclin (FAS1) repeats